MPLASALLRADASADFRSRFEWSQVGFAADAGTGHGGIPAAVADSSSVGVAIYIADAVATGVAVAVAAVAIAAAIAVCGFADIRDVPR